MLNEEIRKFEELTGKNANDFSIAYVGGFLDGYDKGKEDAPAIDPSFITDLNAVKDWSICGYRVEELVKLALTLRDTDINEADLKNYNETFAFGYRTASEEFNKAINNYIFTMTSEIKPEAVVRLKEEIDSNDRTTEKLS